MEELLRMEEVSAWTGIPINTLRFWRANNSGPKSAKLGRRVVYRRADVEKWIADQFEAAV